MRRRNRFLFSGRSAVIISKCTNPFCRHGLFKRFLGSWFQFGGVNSQNEFVMTKIGRHKVQFHNFEKFVAKFSFCWNSSIKKLAAETVPEHLGIFVGLVGGPVQRRPTPEYDSQSGSPKSNTDTGMIGRIRPKVACGLFLCFCQEFAQP